ncbi:MAG: ABC transporter permease [Clostridia bacterium]|nr:ABC transporter permease [Clostridia bacterium]
MYIIKNAFKCIGRSRGRNILIGVIVFVIAVSACIGLSIRQAAENAKSETLEGLTVTATISFDRQKAMSDMISEDNGDISENGRPSFDRDKFSDFMGESSSLTLDEYKKYAEAESVKDFYYSISSSFNGNDDFLPVSNDTTSEDENTSNSNENSFGMNGFFQPPEDMRNQMMGAQSDFTVVGYSSESAMTSFINGTATIVDGAVFTEGTTDAECIISQELANYNSIEVSDTITLENPNNEDESYEFTVVGIYTDSSSNESSFSIMGATSTDPANKIYTSYAALQTVLDASGENSETVTDDTTGREFSTEIKSTLSATYLLSDVDSYNKFTEEVRELGLDKSYNVSSSDISSYESSLVPLETLSKLAGYFLIVVLLIGAIILIVLNIFNIRERKYEIGVLTAMGMKKFKVALQFLTEIFVVTIIAVIVGVGVGGVSSVPVTNALLENQIAAESNQYNKIEENFGRPGNMISDGNMPGNMDQNNIPQMQNGGPGNFFDANEVAEYISEIDEAMNLTVVFQMLGIAILLTIVSGAVSMLFIMRYDPLRILANRD